MARTPPRIQNPELAAALKSALEAGAFSPGKACRVLRALNCSSQEDFAVRLGMNVKVIKALEAGRGNPRYDSLEKIASAVGLRVAFVKRRTELELLDTKGRAADERDRRIASSEAVAAGRVSERRLHERNALRVDGVIIELPPLT